MKVKPTINSTTATGSHTSQKQGGKKQKRMPAQFLLLIASALLLAACSSGLQDLPEVDAAAATKSTQSRITSDQNDAEEKVSGRVIVNSRDLELGYEGKGRQTVALRFEDVKVPRGANIKKAHIQFVTDKTDTASVRVKIRAEDTNNATKFSTSKRNLTKRSKTSSSVSWKLDKWTERGARSSKQKTPNLENVVEEVTKRKGWNSGNSMVFFIAESNSDNKRIAKSHKDSAKSAPVLYVEYTGGKSGGSDSNDNKPKKPTDSGPKVGNADYYVSPKNGSDSNSGSKSKPLRTLRKVSEIVQPGDVVMLRGGTYRGPDQSYVQWTGKAFLRNGKKGQPITIMSYPGEQAVIDGSDIKYTEYKSVSSPILFPAKGDHYIIQDITFQNGAGRCLYIKADNVTVRNVTVRNCHSDGIYVLGKNVVVEDSESYNHYSYQNGGDSADCLKMVAGRDNTIRNNKFRDCSDDGVDIWDSRGTLIEGNISDDNGRGPTGNGRAYKLGTSSAKNTGTVARNNRASGSIVNYDVNGSTGVELYKNKSSNARQAGYIVLRGNDAYNNTSSNDNNNHGGFR